MFDCLAPCKKGAATALWDHGFRVAGRYLETLTQAEADMLHGIGFGILPITEARSGLLTAERGAQTATISGAKATALRIPARVHVVLDSESTMGTKQQVTDYDNSVAAGLARYGYGCCMYVGDSQPLSGEELYALPGVHLYWKSASMVPAPACGWGVIQLSPLNQKLHDILSDYSGEGSTDVFDVSVIQHDYRGRSPIVWMP